MITELLFSWGWAIPFKFKQSITENGKKQPAEGANWWKCVALMSCHINRKLRSQRKLAMDESCSILIFPPSTSSKPGKSRFKKQTHIGGENRRVSSLQHLFQFLISCYSSSYKIQSCNRLVKHTSHKLFNPVQAIICLLMAACVWICQG